jgi:hypothetical protein
MLNVLDEFTHECLAIRVARKLKAIDVIDVLSDLFILRGIPARVRRVNVSCVRRRSVASMPSAPIQSLNPPHRRLYQHYRPICDISAQFLL